jgi:carbon storage regulator
MLVLSRHRNESVMVGNNVKITVVDIRGDKVRLGFEAPPDVHVHRQEVFDAIERNIAAGLEVRDPRQES